jgi:hypothetical protein
VRVCSPREIARSSRLSKSITHPQFRSQSRAF